MKMILLIFLPVALIACARAGYNPPAAPVAAALEQKTETVPQAALHSKKDLKTQQATDESIQSGNTDNKKTKITCLYSIPNQVTGIAIFNNAEIAFLNDKSTNATTQVTCQSKNESKKSRPKRSAGRTKKQETKKLKVGESTEVNGLEITCVDDLQKALESKKAALNIKAASQIFVYNHDSKQNILILCQQ